MCNVSVVWNTSYIQNDNDGDNNNYDNDVTIIIVIVTLKGAIWDFFTICCLQHMHASSQCVIMCKSCATHQALIKCNKSCAMLYKEQFSYSFLPHFIGWKHKPVKETRKLECQRHLPPPPPPSHLHDELQKRPYTKSPKSKPQGRLQLAL